MIGLCAALVLTAGCMRTRTTSQPQDMPVENTTGTTSPGEAANPVETETISADPDFTIEMKPFEFSSKTLQLKGGQTYWVKLINREGMHDFVVDELNVKSNQLTQADEEAMVRIDVPEDAVGETYEFYCSVGNHRQMGMVGTIEVMD